MSKNSKGFKQNLQSKYKSIARARYWIPGDPSRREMMEIKVMLITSGAEETVSAHSA